MSGMCTVCLKVQMLFVNSGKEEKRRRKITQTNYEDIYSKVYSQNKYMYVCVLCILNV